MRQYEEKQLKNQHKFNQKKEKVYRAIPEIKKIDEAISQTSIAIAKVLINENLDPQVEMARLKEKNLELSMKKIELLHTNGLPKDYLQKTYECHKCRDTGFIKDQKCSCFKQAIIDLAYEQSNIKNILEYENFNTFSFDYYSNEIDKENNLSPYDNIKSIYNYCTNFVSQFGKEFSNIIFYGNAGVGKTFLSNCIAKSILDKGFNVIYLSAFQIFEIFERSKFRKDDAAYYDDMSENILSCDLLIVDDLGTEFSTSFTNAQLFNCLNTRLINEKPTIISTNLKPSDWSNQYSNRIVSRIFGNYEPLKVFGEDIRIKKAFN